MSAVTHFLVQLHTLPPAQALKALKSMTLSTKGEQNSGVSTDLFLEHLIGSAKQSMKGGQSLKTMKMFSLNTDLLRNTREIVRNNLGIASSSTHTNPSIRDDVIRISSDLEKAKVVENFHLGSFKNVFAEASIFLDHLSCALFEI